MPEMILFQLSYHLTATSSINIYIHTKLCVCVSIYKMLELRDGSCYVKPLVGVNVALAFVVALITLIAFYQMSELLNQKSSVQGKVPSRYFNAMFDLSGSWLNDTAEADHLDFDGIGARLRAKRRMICSQ